MSLSDKNSTPSDDILRRSSEVFSRIISTSSTNRDSSKRFELGAHHAPRLIPVKTTSLPPPSTKVLISSRSSSIGRHLCLPRAWTVRQKVQKLSHPVWMTIYFLVKSSLPAIFLRDRILSFSHCEVRSNPGFWIVPFHLIWSHCSHGDAIPNSHHSSGSSGRISICSR